MKLCQILHYFMHTMVSPHNFGQKWVKTCNKAERIDWILTFQVDEKKPKKKHIRPFSHIATQVPLSVLADNLNLPDKKIPGELYPYLK